MVNTLLLATVAMVARGVSSISGGSDGPSVYIRLIGSSSKAPEECIELVFICNSRDQNKCHIAGTFGG